MTKWLILQTAALVVGFIIDCIVGDPYCIPHPVVGIGKWISFFDKKLRRGNSNPKDVTCGVMTVVFVAAISTLIPALVLFFAWQIHPIAYFAVNSIIAGDDVKTVQENMGHYSAAFTMDRYGHVTKTMKKNTSTTPK